jgi:DNA-binding NtrC family response regulator
LSHLSEPLERTPRKRIVIVEDDTSLLALLCEGFADSPHQITAFSDFRTAKAYLADNRVDVVITDVRLGAYNGLQLIVFGKLRDPVMTGIVLTGFDDPVIRNEAMRAGAHFVVKPVTPEQVLGLI